jgi:hypothetical protein
MDHSGGLTGITGTGPKGSVAAADDDDSYFGMVTSNSRFGSVDAESANRCRRYYGARL